MSHIRLHFAAALVSSLLCFRPSPLGLTDPSWYGSFLVHISKALPVPLELERVSRLEQF